MKKVIAGVVAGLVLGTAGAVSAAPQSDGWFRNGVTCATTGRGTSRGVVCGLDAGNKIVIVSQRRIIVAPQRGAAVVYYSTTP